MKNYGKYATSVLLFVAVIVLLFLGFKVIKNLLHGNKPKQTQTVKKVDLLAVPEKDDTVQYMIIGPTIGDEQHSSIRIKVNRDFRTVEILQGYDNEIIKSQETPNTLEAYEAFIAALNGAGFAKTFPAEGRGNEAQDCPLSRKFSYEIAPGTSDEIRTWSNSCSSKQGTFGGNASLVRTLFQRQIPNYDQYIASVRVG
jgi:hypothetical protein